MALVRFTLGVLLVSLGAFADTVAPEDWGFDQFVELVKAREAQGAPFQSPDELIRALPEALRRNFTFVFETGNKFQDASPRFPRAIVFTKRLFYSFNGHSSQRGYDSLEFLEFDPKARRFEMREMTFEKTHEGVKVRAENSTPKKCLECHGIDPKPIWHSYNRWPGVYGQNDDSLIGEEQGNYEAFRKSVLADPASRYGALVLPDKDLQYPYGGGDYGRRINLVLTKLFVRLNALRLLRMLQESPYYAQVKWLLPGMTNSHGRDVPNQGSERLKPFVETLVKRHFTRRQIPSAVGQGLALGMGIPVERFTMQLGSTAYVYEDGTESQLPVLRYALIRALAEEDGELAKRIGVSHDYHAERYSSHAMYRDIDNWVGTVFQAQGQESYLDYLGSKAEAQLTLLERGGLPQATLPGDLNTFEGALREAENRRASADIPASCVFCHTVKEGAPRIAFDDPSALKGQLTERNGRLLKLILQRSGDGDMVGDRRMPPPYAHEFAPLSPGQFQSLEKYVKALAEGGDTTERGASGPGY